MRIENLESCSGCHACFSVCPKSAITMSENTEGFLYPQINIEKCINCGLCEKTCPSLNPIKKESKNSKVYAVINKNEAIRLDSSSGGVFTAIAEKVIEENGVVFGAKFASDFSVVHSWTDTIEGLADFRGSKYLQSVIGNSYKECKAFLESGRKVLFSGTPCQVQGLKKYLKKEYENLFCMDIICHGVPSNKIWQKYIDLRLEKCGASRHELVKTAFRRKNDGWKLYSLSFTFANDSEYSENQLKGHWMLTFNKNIMMRKSCYQCPAKDENIISDITAGDFWGIEEYLSDFDDNGTSIIFVNTKKGSNLMSSLADKLDLTEINSYNAEKYNTQLLKSIPYNKNRENFIQMVFDKGFELAYNKYVRPKFYLRIYRFSRHCAGVVLRKVGLLK